ncbi:MAG: glycoside hydrolase family 3 protein [Eubacterium sp.]|nr:glycoside hydrolase family 3 protein [Eubacterium sp.]
MRKTKGGTHFKKGKEKGKGANKILISAVLIVIIGIGISAAVLVSGGNNSKPIAKAPQETTEAEPEETSEELTSEETTAKPEEENEKEKEENLDEAEEILNSMTVEEKVNQLFFVTPEALTNVSVVTAAGPQTKSSLEAHPVGGIVYFTQNFEDEDQAKTMLSNIKDYAEEVCKVPLFLGIDEEGGTVARLGNSEVISVPEVGDMAEIGSTGDYTKAYDAGNTIGAYLKEYGFNLDFAPVADVLTNSENTVVKDRSFGDDPEVVSGMAEEFAYGLNDNGILSCYKHFPGHGATADDTHDGYAYTYKNYDELAESELIPFIQGIKNGVDFIMVGHFSLPNIIEDDTPASLSSAVIEDILKTELGYEGIVITDSLSMEALTENYTTEEIAVGAINAGADMLLMPDDFETAYSAVLEAVENGEISEERIDESVKKIIAKKLSMS